MSKVCLLGTPVRQQELTLPARDSGFSLPIRSHRQAAVKLPATASGVTHAILSLFTQSCTNLSENNASRGRHQQVRWIDRDQNILLAGSRFGDRVEFDGLLRVRREL